MFLAAADAAGGGEGGGARSVFIVVLFVCLDRLRFCFSPAHDDTPAIAIDRESKPVCAVWMERFLRVSYSIMTTQKLFLTTDAIATRDRRGPRPEHKEAQPWRQANSCHLRPSLQLQHRTFCSPCQPPIDTPLPLAFRVSFMQKGSKE